MSYQPDLANLIGRSLDSIASITCTGDGVRVTTHCMYPSMDSFKLRSEAVLKPLLLQMKVAPLARH